MNTSTPRSTPAPAPCALAATLVLLAGGGLRAEITPLTVWEKTFRAPLVARVTVLDGDNRLARMRVDEVIKGEYDLPELLIVFRAENLTRDLWEEKIVFPRDARLILFLKPFEKRDPVKERDQFSLVRGNQGNVEIPAEGVDAFLQAVRRFVEIQSLDSQLARWDAAKALLAEANPYLVEAGFQQILKFRLADEQLVPQVLLHLEGDSVPFRGYAAQTLGQVLEDNRALERVLPTEDHVRDLLLHTAMNDPSPPVRVDAIRALQARQDANLVPSLEQIARDDPSQDVRYQATRTIFELKERIGSPPRSN